MNLLLCVILFLLAFVRLEQTGFLGKCHEHTHISLEEWTDNSKNNPFVLFPHALSFSCRLNVTVYRVTHIVFLSIPYKIICDPLFSLESGILELI